MSRIRNLQNAFGAILWDLLSGCMLQGNRRKVEEIEEGRILEHADVGGVSVKDLPWTVREVLYGRRLLPDPDPGRSPLGVHFFPGPGSAGQVITGPGSTGRRLLPDPDPGCSAVSIHFFPGPGPPARLLPDPDPPGAGYYRTQVHRAQVITGPRSWMLFGEHPFLSGPRSAAQVITGPGSGGQAINGPGSFGPGLLPAPDPAARLLPDPDPSGAGYYRTQVLESDPAMVMAEILQWVEAGVLRGAFCRATSRRSIGGQ